MVSLPPTRRCTSVEFEPGGFPRPPLHADAWSLSLVSAGDVRPLGIQAIVDLSGLFTALDVILVTVSYDTDAGTSRLYNLTSFSCQTLIRELRAIHIPDDLEQPLYPIETSGSNGSFRASPDFSQLFVARGGKSLSGKEDNQFDRIRIVYTLRVKLCGLTQPGKDLAAA